MQRAIVEAHHMDLAGRMQSSGIIDRSRTVWLWIRRLAHFARRVASAFANNRGFLLAGGVGYNALLSLVPFVSLTVATLSMFFDEQRIITVLHADLDLLVPGHTDTLLQATKSFLDHPAAISTVSIGFLLFFCSIAFRMLEEAVATIFHVASAGAERRFWISAMIPYAFILILMVAFLAVTVLTIAGDVLSHYDLHFFHWEISLAYGVQLALRLAAFVGLVGLFAALYRILPVVKVKWSRAATGGLCAAILWRVVGYFMFYYFANISQVNLFYGSLATVIVLLLFLEAAFIILLIGAQVIAELEASSSQGLPWYEAPKNSPHDLTLRPGGPKSRGQQVGRG